MLALRKRLDGFKVKIVHNVLFEPTTETLYIIVDREIEGYSGRLKLRQGLDCQRGDDTNCAATATAKHPEDIRVLSGACCNESAIRQNN